MVNFKRIYRTRAADYDRMIGREDYQGNILQALQAIVSLSQKSIIDIGSGTGRLARLTAPIASQITALDISPHMLTLAKHSLSNMANCHFAVGDNRRLPLQSVSADIVLAGWSLGHLVGWYPDSWRGEIGRTLSEMHRLLHPNGTIIIFETLGTGRTTPQPPHAGLATYYAWLEQAQGFNHQSIRTDYQFASVPEADRLTRFFFGDELANRIVQEKLTILPECTGVWWRTAA